MQIGCLSPHFVSGSKSALLAFLEQWRQHHIAKPLQMELCPVLHFMFDAILCLFEMPEGCPFLYPLTPNRFLLKPLRLIAGHGSVPHAD